MENEAKSMSTRELTSAVRLLLEKEEARVEQEARKQRRRVRRRREEMRASITQLTRSIEIIKWCIVGIASVMAASLLILVLVVWQIGNEAQRIKSEVEQIKGKAEAMVRQIEQEAQLIRDKIQHPLRSIGGAIGGQLESKIGNALGLEEQ
jgi:Na+-transporting methylmalonyl-CoA/oxaloacetate decarboxylase gamma subunit